MSTPKQETMITADGQVGIIRTEEFERWYSFNYIDQIKRIAKLESIAVYVRDNHLCGTPLLEAINEVVSVGNTKTEITKT